MRHAQSIHKHTQHTCAHRTWTCTCMKQGAHMYSHAHGEVCMHTDMHVWRHGLGAHPQCSSKWRKVRCSWEDHLPSCGAALPLWVYSLPSCSAAPVGLLSALLRCCTAPVDWSALCPPAVLPPVDWSAELWGVLRDSMAGMLGFLPVAFVHQDVGLWLSASVRPCLTLESRLC